MKAANDTVRFLVELAALAAVCYWGFHDHSSRVAKLVLGIGGPVVIASTWAIWMAPQSNRRATEDIRALLEVVIFSAGNRGTSPRRPKQRSPSSSPSLPR